MKGSALVCSLVLLSVCASLVSAQVLSPPNVLGTNSSAIKFVVLGTWGRVGACSQLYSYDVNFCIGAFEQLGNAGWIDEVCGLYGPCDFIATPGHCFYPAGAHATDNPSRFITDWRNVFQLDDKQNIRDLPWYITLGDHDQGGDVSQYLNYHNVDTRWNFPSRYYLQDISNPYINVSVRIVVLDDQPWLSGNVAQPGKTYKAGSNQANPEFQFQNQPAQVNAQLNFLEAALNTSKADYTIVVQHQPIWGTTNGYAFQDAQANASSPFNREIAILTKYNISAVFTADDYVVHYGRVNNITLTPQFNVGSISEADCNDGQLTNSTPYRVPWPQWVNSNCSTDQSNNGFIFVTATKQSMQVDLYTTTFQQVNGPNYYTVPNYSSNYTVLIPPGQLKGPNGGVTSGPTGKFFQTAPAPAPAATTAAAATPQVAAQG